MVSFAVQKLFSLIVSHLIIFVFIFSTVGGGSKKTFLCVLSKNVFLMFPVRVLYCPILALGLWSTLSLFLCMVLGSALISFFYM